MQGSKLGTSRLELQRQRIKCYRKVVAQNNTITLKPPQRSVSFPQKLRISTKEVRTNGFSTSDVFKTFLPSFQTLPFILMRQSPPHATQISLTLKLVPRSQRFISIWRQIKIPFVLIMLLLLIY